MTRTISGSSAYSGVWLNDLMKQESRCHPFVSYISEIQTLPRKDRNEILDAALINGVGVRQLARLTGVSYGIIQRINEKVGQRTVP